MIITCGTCKTSYRVDAQLLGAQGRAVRCSNCKQVWEQPQTETFVPPPEPVPEPVPEAVPAIDIDFAPTVRAESPAPAPKEETFQEILKQTAAAIAPAPKIPEAVMPSMAKTPAPAVYRPMGMTALQFGVLGFLFCTFVSLSALFLAKAPVVRHWPSASLLYKTLGIHVAAPGEGLRLGAVTVENRVDRAGRALAVEGKLTNMTQKEAAYPAMRLTLSSAYGAVLKTWVLDNKDQKPLAPGADAPVKFSFDDAPEGGTDIELKVIER